MLFLCRLGIKQPRLAIRTGRYFSILHSDSTIAHEMKRLNEENKFDQVIQLFDTYTKQNTSTALPSRIVAQALKACAQKGDVKRVKDIHQRVSSSIANDPYISSSLINFYIQSADIETAESLFKNSKTKGMPLYGLMMKGYIQNHQPIKAIDLFYEIDKPDDVIFILMFKACAQLEGKQASNLIQSILSKMPSSFYSNPHLLTSLIHALMNCGDVQTAEILFHKVPTKGIFIYGAMMKGYVKNKQANKAIDLFHQMKEHDHVIYILLFNACAQLESKTALNLVQKVSSDMPKSYQLGPNLVTSLVDALMKCRDVKGAEAWFNRVKTKHSSLYGAMMKGYIKNGLTQNAIDLFHQIQNPDEIILFLLFNACAQMETKEIFDLVKSVSSKMPTSFYSNPRLLTSLLDALMTHGDVKRAEELFKKSLSKNLSMYGAMMKAYTRNGMPKKTIELFDQVKRKGLLRQTYSDTKMKLSHETNSDDTGSCLNIYVLIINALARLYDFSSSESIVKDIPPSYFSHPHIRNALIDMWGKIGCIDKAKEVYESDDREDSVKYTAMINNYGLNGMGMEAIDLYEQIPQHLIDEVTHICVLNACSHSGLVSQARSIFSNIRTKTGKIYTAMIDCLSRAFLFQEAQQLVDQYEQEHPSDLVMYMTLLSGARNAKSTRLADEIFARMNKLFPQQTDSWVSASVLLANTYTSSGDISTATDIKVRLAQSGMKKKSGLSWTTTSNGKYYEFRAHDQSHPRSSEIYAELNRISKQLIEHGHQYDQSWITRPIEADETDESVLCGHSERLAIAWNFVEDPKSKMIRVAKNIRICGDCHRATKLIAAIRQCHISVRDANRIHHFSKNGQCSCNDHF